MSENLTEYQRGGSPAWKGHWEPSRAAGFRLGEVRSRNLFTGGASNMATPFFSLCPLLQAFLLLGFVVVAFETEPRYIA